MNTLKLHNISVTEFNNMINNRGEISNIFPLVDEDDNGERNRSSMDGIYDDLYLSRDPLKYFVKDIVDNNDDEEYHDNSSWSKIFKVELMNDEILYLNFDSYLESDRELLINNFVSINKIKNILANEHYLNLRLSQVLAENEMLINNKNS